MTSVQSVTRACLAASLVSLGTTGSLSAQGVASAKVAAPATISAADKDSLVRVVAREKLVFLLENLGLNSQSDSWRKTITYKLLTETHIGSMLELVCTQFLDQLLATDANRKVTGAEIVSLIKHVAKNGWVLAINGVDKGSSPYSATVVFRGATSKALRPVTSRLLGAAMGDIRPRIVRRENRTIVAVDVPQAAVTASIVAAPGAVPKIPVQTWVWWAEKDDLVIGIFPGDDGGSLCDTLDGKTPSALTHPAFLDAKRAENGENAMVTRLVDLSALNPTGKAGWLTNALLKLKEITGSQRVAQRLGFDNQAIVTTTRLASPKPFSSTMSLFEAPAFKKTDLIPMPDGVHSFATFSIKAERALGLIDQVDPSGDLKLKILEFAQSLKTSSRIDLEKDLLERIGPKMTFYLSPLLSAAAEDELPTLQSLYSGGMNLASLMAMSRPFLPEATFVAELKDPVAFGKALDGLIIAINKELKARATEQEESEAEQSDSAPGGGRRRGEEGESSGKGRRGGSGSSGDRNKTSKKPEVLYPKFNPISSPTNVRKFLLSTPTAAKYRLGPPHFRPMIYADLKHLAMAASAGTAESAIEALGDKSWKPSAELQEALSTVPADVVAVAVFNSGEKTASMLSSFPGTMQTYINTGIAISKLLSPQAAAPQPAAPVAANPPSQGRDARPRRGRRDEEEGFGGRMQGEGMTPPGGLGNAPPGQPALVVPQMVQFQVGSDQLPKSQEIRPLLFPTTISVVADDQGLKITQRSAFPEQIGLESNATAIGFLMPIIQAARARAQGGVPIAGQPNAAGPNNPGGVKPNPAGIDPTGSPRNSGRRRRDL